MSEKLFAVITPPVVYEVKPIDAAKMRAAGWNWDESKGHYEAVGKLTQEEVKWESEEQKCQQKAQQ